MPFLDMQIVDESGVEVPEGQLGELLFYGPTITPGYWNRPDDTAETVRDGWLYTGDLGYRDSEGFYFVVDRAKDMILRGGENVYCTEIENCLADHDEIDEAAIVGGGVSRSGRPAEAGRNPPRFPRLSTKPVGARGPLGSPVNEPGGTDRLFPYP